MAGGGSQLKRLKASLRDQGIVGPQQSKKQKRKAAEDVRGRNEKRLQRGVVLDGIREQFNPFDLKHAKGPKFEVTSNRPTTNNRIKGRPGEAKAAAEEKRRQTLLVDMQHRHKVGGILDQRFGESDPTMTPEEKAMERFAREQMRSHKKSSMFDLEDDDDDDSGGLTHGGKALEFDDDTRDDFDEDMGEDDDEEISELDRQRRKRLRAMKFGDDDEDEEEQPERKKTKKEVMEEIIAKSKLGKFERQQQKEDDEDLRMEIDQDLPQLQYLLAQGQKRLTDEKHVDIAGVDRKAFDKNYDFQVRKLAQDRRAQPTERTKTEYEKAEEKQKQLKKLEEKREKRMRGEQVTDSEDDGEDDDSVVEEEDDMDEDDDFGLGAGITTQPRDDAAFDDEDDFNVDDDLDVDTAKQSRMKKNRPTAAELGGDEDDFLIEDDLIASGSDIDDEDLNEYEDEEESLSGEEESEEEDDDFTKGLLNEEEARNPAFKELSISKEEVKNGDNQGLPFTFACPQTPEEFATIAKEYSDDKLLTIIIRIRTLYHPRLDAKNKERLGVFATMLVDFVSSPFGSTQYDASVWPSFGVLEGIIRHIHSLAKMFPIEIAKECRQKIEDIGAQRSKALEAGDLMLLTVVGTVFPTSDHFHQVVTPAMLTAVQYLGLKTPHTLADHAVGEYLSILAVQYQQLSKRYIPEVVNFLLQTICTLSPAAISKRKVHFPSHQVDDSLRIQDASKTTMRKLSLADCGDHEVTEKDARELKVALLDTALQTCEAAADTWSSKSSFVETAGQMLAIVKHLASSKCRAHLPPGLCTRVDKLGGKLERMARVASLGRKPLELHHHRPLAIKTYIPKFEDDFDPDKHYDPNRERAELAKLKAEHKRERKGAMRELRKDASFMAREKLKMKVAKEAAHEKKMNRIVAEIQNEEGREANEYERERKARKRARNR